MNIPYPVPAAMPEGATFADGVWSQTFTPRTNTESKAALFLDRDGVLVEDAHYLHEPDKVRMTPGAAKAVRQANDQSVPVILVTNQAGIGYGYFGWDDFVAVQARILSELAREGAFVDGVFACPFHEKAKPPFTHPDHPARKPNPGMLTLSEAAMGVNLSASWIIGDRALDLEAGRNAGLAGGVHVLTGHGNREGEREAALAVAMDGFAVLGAENLSAGIKLVPLLKA